MSNTPDGPEAASKASGEASSDAGGEAANDAGAVQDIEPDDGSPRARREPKRQCAVSRDVLSKAELIRFVADPEGHIVPDLKAVLPGRGVWVRADASHVALAEQRKLFARLLGKKSDQTIIVDAGLADRVEKLLLDRAMGALALAQKSGRIITGFAKVESAIGADNVEVLIVASDGAEDSLRKLKQAITRRFGSSDALQLYRSFNGVELDLAFGRTNVIHAALTKAEKKTDRGDGGFLNAAERLQTYIGARAETEK